MHVRPVSGHIRCSVKLFALRSLALYLLVIGSSSLTGLTRIRRLRLGRYGLTICDEFDSTLNGEMVTFG